MNYKTLLAAVAVAIPLLITGCSSNPRHHGGTISITTAPPATLGENQTATIAATTTGGLTAAGVDWSCTPVGACGTFNPAHTASGATTVYTAPAATGPVSIIAASTETPTTTATASVTIKQYVEAIFCCAYYWLGWSCRAGHRRRTGRAGLPDRLTPRHRHLPFQRVGRANHQRHGVHGGTALPDDAGQKWSSAPPCLAAVREGRLDLLDPPSRRSTCWPNRWWRRCAQPTNARSRRCGTWSARPHPTPSCGARPSTTSSSRASWGIETRTGSSGRPSARRRSQRAPARPGRGARPAALTGGGAIPETGDYRVVLDPDGVTVGSVHEDFAVEATAGDIFLFGTHSWRVTRSRWAPCGCYDAAISPQPSPSG